MKKIEKFENEKFLFFDILKGKTKWKYDYLSIQESSIGNIEKVNVFYNYYKPPQEERQEEIDYCFKELLKNDKIDNLYVLSSDEVNIQGDFVEIQITGQPKFNDFFKIIDFYSEENDINIILNSDCFLKSESIDIIKNNLKNDEAYVLSRWDILQLTPFKTEHFNVTNKDESGCSQDCWIFRGKTKNGLEGDFEMGRAGCDNAIAYEFDTAGYKVSNPSFTIKVYHYHLSGIRTYGDYELKGVDRRQKSRVNKPYKFFPSSFLEENLQYEIIFYNHYHNGDIHFSREFIKDIMKKYKAKKYSYWFDTSHVSSEDIIKDCEIEIINTLPSDISEIEKFHKIKNKFYINTWVGRNKYELVNKYGINIEANYELYKEIYKELNIKLEQINYYMPQIDFSYYNVSKIDKFLKKFENSIKVLISNGATRSAQSENFDMNNAIDGLSSSYKEVLFILTDSTNKINKNNIFYTDDIIGKKSGDLNEISYLSTKCNLIVGRSSGPYAFSLIKENLENPKKYFLSFIEKPEYEWVISKSCEHHVVNKYKLFDLISEISRGIDYSIENKDNKFVQRIAFTIILNGLHHLKHNNYGEFLAKNFDYWIIVEGASKNYGSTSWCKEMPSKYHKNGKSIDGTIEYIKKLKNKYNNIIFVESNGLWNSKDDMVNRCVEEARKITNRCFLWQVDIDEVWTKEQIIKSEEELRQNRSKTGKFKVFQFVGENLIAFGKDWAGVPFTRLWDWSGENFLSHEPPVLNTPDKSEILLSEKMKHYAFYFEEDVKFKNDWYNDHEGSFEMWKKLKNEKIFPQHITYLFPNFKGSSYIANSNNLDCQIIKYKSDIEYNDFNIFVDKSYCINLERREDRKEHMEKEFERLKLDYKFFKAFDGKDLNIKEIPIRKAIISTVKSHLGVIQDAIKNNYETIAVFEDDVIFCEDFDERFKIYLKEVPEDWEIMYLGCHFNSCAAPKKITNYVYSVKEAFGCFAMILNNNNGLFKRILNYKNDTKPYDNHIKENILPSTSAYVFIPFFVRTLKTKSDISERTDSFSYDVVDKYFLNKLQINDLQIKQEIKKPQTPPPLPVHKPHIDYIKSSQEICEDYVRLNIPFQIYQSGRLIFDSDTSDKRNLYFFREGFTLYGRNFSYQGMLIKRK